MKESGLFHVDSLGRVWTCRNGSGYPTPQTYWKQTGRQEKNGRWVVSSFDGRQVFRSRLVWYWFNGEIPPEYEIDHGDEDVGNDHPLNLLAMTRQRNLSFRGVTGFPTLSHDTMSAAAKRGWEKRRSHG
jgi:hypothetical protein